jgi:hypothetical protein
MNAPTKHIAIAAAGIMALLVACQARADGAQMPVPAEDQQLYTKAAREIYRIVPEGEHFGLSLGKRVPPAFPGRVPGEIDSPDCERTAAFDVIGNANELGWIKVWECKDSPKLRELLRRAQTQPPLKAGSPNALEARMGHFSASKEADGAELYYVPVIIAGPTMVLVFPTAVKIDRPGGRAFVTQAMLYDMCDAQRRNRYTAICGDPEGFLKSVSSAVSH